jgi:hypothetical protein
MTDYPDSDDLPTFAGAADAVAPVGGKPDLRDEWAKKIANH